jgi:FMN phosphatase YigB (HAD superfamily)
MIIEKIKVSPDRVLFLDDHEPNVGGGRTAGLRAELFPRGGGLDALTVILTRHGLSL